MSARKRRWLSIGLPVMVVAVVVAAIGLRAWQSWVGTHTLRENIETRYARLAGLLESAETLQRSVEDSEFRLGRFAYAADVDKARTEAELQQLVRRAFETAGMTVSGSQVVKGKSYKGYEEMQVSINASGSIEAVQAALLALQRERPRLFVDTFTMGNERARRGAQTTGALSVQATISAIHLLP